MNAIKDKIKKTAAKFLPEIIAIRRHIHANPELAFEEFKTSQFIISNLEAMGISHQNNIAKTGIVALIEGKNPLSKVTMLRADMDALTINEENEVDYKSLNKGVMHACGHDVHIASLLGAAKILMELRNEFSGTVKLIFQPSEEKFPGGALQMIKEGVLDNPKANNIIGQHVLPTLEVGKIGLKTGKYMASTDEVYITIYGKGGHGATPELNIDPVIIASHIVVALQQLVSRNAMPSVPSVLSFGRFIANGRTNIIPDEVKIEGTFRTFDEVWRSDAHKKITKMASLIAESMGAACDVRIDKGYPFLVNDIALTLKVKEYAIDFLGEENVEDLDLRMTAEDFAYYSQQIPACFYRLGIRNEKKGITSNLHTSTFDIDENALEIGMGLMAWITFRELSL
ncbi:MAG: N-acyl-L-amino acid amidohydrolase [Bacteroidetes bacterium CG2_30_32_10]|nr:MAG: N-acyl-L-amino acid amidohydrolase [Bacteroidetes bacterium CG2_30_32_10]